MKTAKGFLLCIGLLFLSYGIYCLINPNLLHDLTGMILSDNTALIEVRAMYGGLQITTGIYLIYCALNSQCVPQALILCVFMFAGLAGARAFGLTIDGGDNGYNFSAAIFEAISGIIALALLKQINKS